MVIPKGKIHFIIAHYIFGLIVIKAAESNSFRSVVHLGLIPTMSTL